MLLVCPLPFPFPSIRVVLHYLIFSLNRPKVNVILNGTWYLRQKPDGKSPVMECLTKAQKPTRARGVATGGSNFFDKIGFLSSFKVGHFLKKGQRPP